MLNKKKIVAAISSSYNVGLGFGSVAPEVQTRYFTTLSAAAAQQFVPASSITLPVGDRAFELEFYATVIGTSSSYILTATSGNTISVATTAVGLFCRINFSSGVYIPISEVVTGFNKVRMWRVASANKVYTNVNGGAIYSVDNTNNLPTTISYFGGSFSGVVSNIKLWSGSFDFDSEPTYSWAIDSDGSTSTETATTGGINLTRVNLTQADTELYTLNETTTPAQWENSDKSVIIPVGY